MITASILGPSRSLISCSEDCAERNTPARLQSALAATEALIVAAEDRGPLMHARIGVMPTNCSFLDFGPRFPEQGPAISFGPKKPAGVNRRGLLRSTFLPIPARANGPR